MSDMEHADIERLLGLGMEGQALQTLRLILRLAVAVAGADEGSLLVYDPARHDLVFAMTEGRAQGETALRGRRVVLGHGPVGLAAATMESHAGPPRAQAGDTPRPTMEIAAPIAIDDALFGVVTAVSFRDDARFGPAVVRQFGGFATIAGVLIEQTRRLHPPAEATATGAAERDMARAIHRLAAERPDTLPMLGAIVAAFVRAVAPDTDA